MLVLIVVGYYRCPIYALLGVPCPTCGVTRAMLSLLRLDIRSYFKYNAMAFFLVTAVMLAIFKSTQRRSLLIDIYVYSVLVINAVYYAVRLYFLFG